MDTQVRGIRRILPRADGDTIHLEDPRMFRNQKPFPWTFPKKSLTAKGLLKVRLLGIDTPELHYPGPNSCPVGAHRLRGPARPRIYAQEPWGSLAKIWLDKRLQNGARVIVDLDREVFDRHGRLLGYVWTARGQWQKDDLLNVLAVRLGYAFPYQLWPNLGRFRSIKEAAKAAIAVPRRGVFAAHSDRLLSLPKVAQGKAVNEPFLYRKVVDGAICQVPPKSLLVRFVGDARSLRYYPPRQYWRVPIPYRIFFDTRKDAQEFGFKRAKG